MRLKDRLALLVGRKNYINHIMFLTKLYHTFRPFRHRAARLIRERLMPRGGVVLDIGANIGKFTAMAAGAVGPSGHVYSFEPVPMVLRVIHTMVRLRRLRQVTVVAAALSDRNGKADITVPLKDGWKPLVPIAHLGGAVNTGGLRFSIELKRLDDFCKDEKVSRVDLIKCDTEGSELAVFSGGLQCLRRHLPAVVCEIYAEYLARQKATPAGLFRLFTPLGYLAYFINPPGTLTPVREYAGPADYLFVHPSRIEEKSLVPFIQAPQ